MSNVNRVDATTITEEESIRRFGKPMNDFMKAVAKAAKRHKIEAYALWMYNRGAMRICSAGIDDTGRAIAKQIGLMMAEQNEALMENVARRAKGVPDQ